jgi:uncharacterized protein YecT (DUF1311 family)
MRRSFAFAFLATTGLVLAAALPAKAVQHEYSREYRQCMGSGDAARGVTAGMMDCIGAEVDKQDARLNLAYKAAMARSDAGRRAALRASERAWIRKRDSGCQKEADTEAGGSLAGILFAECVLGATVDRRTWLDSYR